MGEVEHDAGVRVGAGRRAGGRGGAARDRKTVTFVAALRSTGVVAPLVVDGAMNGPLFAAYVRQQLVRALKPGDIVVMDNLSSHKVAGVAAAIPGLGRKWRTCPRTART
ncbi:IS630 family transposase [Limnoglobus roseus]|uniref:IS630 family transposase n=1 Tax=Limnoglobus roseus TaxID=2598579 RepID=A0A5C1AS72_9BACT|nr:transposase [Limnoglobus roseus]QEL20933.1 IS630 family transposase [Limnoglobus roseus]